jgi:hypothetical protein
MIMGLGSRTRIHIKAGFESALKVVGNEHVLYSINFAVVFDNMFSVSAPVKQNELAMSYQIRETLP